MQWIGYIIVFLVLFPYLTWFIGANAQDWIISVAFLIFFLTSTFGISYSILVNNRKRLGKSLPKYKSFEKAWNITLGVLSVISIVGFIYMLIWLYGGEGAMDDDNIVQIKPFQPAGIIVFSTLAAIVMSFLGENLRTLNPFKLERKTYMKTRKEKVYTHLPARSVEPAAHAETHQGLFSHRSYDVGCGPEQSINPEDAMEMKVLQSENSGGWQTIRGFIGASFIAAVDSHFNEETHYHTILVLPTSEYLRIPSMEKLSPDGGEIELVLTPSDSSDDKVSFEDAYNLEGTIITPVYRGHIGAMFAKFPSHATSYVGLYHRLGTLRAKWRVRTVVGGEYTAVVYSVQSFDADLPDGISLYEYWP